METSRPSFQGFTVGKGKHLRRRSVIARYGSEYSTNDENEPKFINSQSNSYNYLSRAPTDDSVNHFNEDNDRTNNRQRSLKKMISNLCSAKLVDDDERYKYMPSDEMDMDETTQYDQTTNSKLMRPNDNCHTDGHKLDIIIFGATGSLGSYTVLRAATMLCNYKWGIAGRNNLNLQKVLRNVSAMTNRKLNGISIFIVDATDKESLLAMAEECHVVVNCCGPYEKTALAVIECCITVGTNYVDACVEPSFLRQIQRKYSEEARRRHVYVITSCGFMNFAIDVGINYVDSRFKGDVYTVEAYTQFHRLDNRKNAPLMSCAAFQNLVGAFASAKEILAINFNYPCADHFPKLTYGSPMRSSDHIQGISIPLPFITPPTVQQTQEYLHDFEQKPPIQFKNFLTFPSYFTAFLALLWCALLFVLAQAPGTRNLVTHFPNFFSMGLCTTDCLQKESLDKYAFTVTLKATGWTDPKNSKTKLTKCSCHTPNPNCAQNGLTVSDKSSNKIFLAEMVGLNPFYGYGCVALLASATTILRETSEMPDMGGVYTPGAAFRYTGILQHIVNQDKNYRFKLK